MIRSAAETLNVACPGASWSRYQSDSWAKERGGRPLARHRPDRRGERPPPPSPRMPRVGRPAPRHGRRVEEEPHRHLDPEGLAEPRGDLRRQERVAAEVEEVIVDPDAVDPEDVGQAAASPPPRPRPRRRRRGVGRRRPVGPEGQQSGASTLPCSVSGRAPTATNADGIMYPGTFGPSHARNSAADAIVSPRGARYATSRRSAGAGLAGEDDGLAHARMPGGGPPRSRPARSGSRGS